MIENEKMLVGLMEAAVYIMESSTPTTETRSMVDAILWAGRKISDEPRRATKVQADQLHEALTACAPKFADDLVRRICHAGKKWDLS